MKVPDTAVANLMAALLRANGPPPSVITKQMQRSLTAGVNIPLYLRTVECDEGQTVEWRRCFWLGVLDRQCGSEVV
jgi:hypothetical protein